MSLELTRNNTHTKKARCGGFNLLAGGRKPKKPIQKNIRRKKGSITCPPKIQYSTFIFFFKHNDLLNHNFRCLQMISPTARRVSPPECSASTFPPWRRTPPTYSEPSFEPSGSPTPAPRETSRGLSSTRCVNWPFIPNVSTAQGGKHAQFPSRVRCRWVRKMKTFILGCPAVPLSSFHALIIIPCATAKWILH